MDLTTTTDSIAQSRSVSGRSRNGRFVGAWAGSLATSEIPDYPSRANRVTWSISEHAKSLEQKLTRDITPSTPASQTVAPQFWHSQNIDTSQPFEPWIYRYRDTGSTLPHPPSNPKTEWPTLNKDILPHLSRRPLTGPASAADASDEAIPESAVVLVQHEAAKVDDRGLVTDQLIHDEILSHSPDWKSILRNLWWRGCRQLVIWELFEALVDRGLINPDCLTLPVDLYGTTN
ncbi:hypothetical protein PoHVEF18_000568 [Penicillium ochrochloron]